MNAVTVSPDETLELRLKAMRLTSLLTHYVALAERATHEGWTHVRYLAELVVLEAAVSTEAALIPTNSPQESLKL